MAIIVISIMTINLIIDRNIIKKSKGSDVLIIVLIITYFKNTLVSVLFSVDSELFMILLVLVVDDMMWG